MNEKKKLLNELKKHDTFNEEIQKKVGRDRAVVYSVYFLENIGIEATFQRISVVAFKLFPESFSFLEFPEYPDSRVIRNCLWHCVHKSKQWLIGSDKTHYNTTEKGKEVVKIFLKLIENNMDIKSLPFYLQIRGITKKELITKATDAEINFIQEIKNSKAYLLFMRDKDAVRSVDIKKSLGGDRYSPSSYIYNKLTKALKLSELTNDTNLKLYLNWVKNNWSKLVGD